MTTLTVRRAHVPFRVVAPVVVVAWLAAWFANLPLANWAAYDLLGLERGSHLGDAVAFFLLDVPKVLLLLLGIMTAVSFLRSYFPPERMRAALAGRGTVPATVGAAAFGVVTPFCSCSAVPLFIGFVEAGIPLGRHLRVPDQQPDGQRGCPRPALGPLRTRDRAPLHGGRADGRRRRRAHPRAPAAREVDRALGPRGPGRGGATSLDLRLSVEQRMRDAWTSTKDLVRRVLLYVIIGIGIGAFIHGFVPTELVAQIGGRENPFAVPIVVAIAIPLYSNAAGTIPIVEALLGKGMPLGTTLAFMMAIVAISLPEFVILRRVMQLRLIAVFAAVVVAGILAVGFLFNALGI